MFKDQDKDKDLSSKDKDKDKDFSSMDKDKLDKDCIFKDKDKDCILVLTESSRTRTNITARRRTFFEDNDTANGSLKISKTR